MKKSRILRNKSGLTLVEIIISIALLGMISVAFLTSLTSHYIWLSATKSDITESLFLAQKEIEMNIAKIKESLNNGEAPEVNIASEEVFTLFSGAHSREVITYKTEALLKGERKLLTFVGETRMSDFPVPAAEDLKLVIRRNNIETGLAMDNYEYYDHSNLSLHATSTKIDPESSFYRNRHDWYVSINYDDWDGLTLNSPPGFNIPMISEHYYSHNAALLDNDHDYGRLYPLFPYDFVPVPIKTEINHLNTSDLKSSDTGVDFSHYAGRQIIYTVTPFAMSGRKGKTVISEPIFLMGPLYTDNLVIHLDASTISKADITSIKDELVNADDLVYVKAWKNLRPSPNHTSMNTYSAVQNIANHMPILKGDSEYLRQETPFQWKWNATGGMVDKRVWGKALGNHDGSVNPANMMLNYASDYYHGFTLFIVFRQVENPLASEVGHIIKGESIDKSWRLGWNAAQLLFFDTAYIPETEDEEEPPLNPVPATLEEGLEIDEWYLGAIRIGNSGSPDELSNAIDFNVFHLHSDHEITTNMDASFYDLYSDNIEILFNGVDISEILLYDRDIGYSSYNNVVEFLKNKYNPQ